MAAIKSAPRTWRDVVRLNASGWSANTVRLVIEAVVRAQLYLNIQIRIRFQTGQRTACGSDGALCRAVVCWNGLGQNGVHFAANEHGTTSVNSLRKAVGQYLACSRRIYIYIIEYIHLFNVQYHNISIDRINPIHQQFRSKAEVKPPFQNTQINIDVFMASQVIGHRDCNVIIDPQSRFNVSISNTEEFHTDIS
ncbi:Hypothetical_protein [Hexamita inflata]|uniref:Hypothetical_protein n=1 Tax=Hexamita inflata TaxID=28002 RepID=A0AA86QZR8_9EUKA|nr:Hypothetical protein HINF_LOCUS56704 [Hexamita inflata]